MSKTTVFINELHYSNIGIDRYEGVEIAALAGTNLQGWSLHFYNGEGRVYSSLALSGLVSNLKSGFGTMFFPIKGLIDSNGGVALVDNNLKLVLFLSYDKVIVAVAGPAQGTSSELLPIHEGFWNSVENSLQLVGKGSYYEDFHWVIQNRSNGALNKGQTFVPVVKPPPAPVTVPVTVEQPKPVTTISAVDLQSKLNRGAHNTSNYNAEMLIIRRAQTVFLIVNGTNLASAKLRLRLALNPEQHITEIPVNDSTDRSSFYANCTKQSDTSLEIILYTSPLVPIGQYSLTVLADDVNFEVVEPIAILFNPWSKLDTVFLDNEELRQEYITNEQGLIWRGTAESNSPVAWNYGQFQAKCLLCALSLIENISVVDRADPVIVSRKLTVLENSKVLIGNWSGNYEGGASPTSWTGSKEILTQYYQTKQPVKFAQCWVFAGTLCTLLRTLGIPSRPVTNFESAHDANENRRVDKYYGIDGKIDDEKTNDSIWNFHVWNDAWFARTDLLDPKYSGWQAVDATPQEESEGEYQAGPCPLLAIKMGEKVPYDWSFIYAEVNADINHYIKTKSGDYKLVNVKTDGVGLSLSTKAVGKMALEDVTPLYKFKEGTKEERVSFTAEDKRIDLLVEGRIEVPPTQTGDPIPIDIFVKSSKGLEKDTKSKIVFKATVVYYTGKPRAELITITKDIDIPADGSEVNYSLVIEEKDYMPYLNDNHHLDLRVLIYSDADADVDSLIMKRFSLTDPTPVIDVPRELPSTGEGKIVVSFTNPLSVPLTNVVFSLEGSGVTPRSRLPPQNILPKETLKQVFNLKEERKRGERNVKALVSSKELETVQSFVTVVVV